MHLMYSRVCFMLYKKRMKMNTVHWNYSQFSNELEYINA